MSGDEPGLVSICPFTNRLLGVHFFDPWPCSFFQVACWCGFDVFCDGFLASFAVNASKKQKQKQAYSSLLIAVHLNPQTRCFKFWDFPLNHLIQLLKKQQKRSALASTDPFARASTELSRKACFALRFSPDDLQLAGGRAGDFFDNGREKKGRWGGGRVLLFCGRVLVFSFCFLF